MNKNNLHIHIKRVGKTANLVIFLGILGIILSILALTVSHALAQRGYGLSYILLGLLMMGLGYGIRYRCKYSLYAATALFIVLSGSFLHKLILYHTTYLTLRLFLCSWVSFRLLQVIPSMKALIEANTFPDRSNRFMEFLLRRKNP